MEVFQHLNQQGITILIVTHEPDIANFAKRQIVFRDGKIRTDRNIAAPQDASKVLQEMPVIDDEVEA